MEKLGHAAGGAGVAIMAPLLDNQVGKLNMLDTATGEKMEKRLPTLEEGKNCLSHNHILNYFRIKSREYSNKTNEKSYISFLAFNLVHDCFVAAAERQIHVADAINFKIITKSGIEEKAMPLRRD